MIRIIIGIAISRRNRVKMKIFRIIISSKRLRKKNIRKRSSSLRNN